MPGRSGWGSLGVRAGENAPPPPPSRVKGTRGFWRQEWVSPDLRLGAGAGHSPWEEARGLAGGGKAGQGRTVPSRWGRGVCPQLPSAVSSVCCFGSQPCVPVPPPLSRNPVPVPSVPTPFPEKISYHCCICNLWMRGLSIYYYWLMILMVEYVIRLPSICLSRRVSEVTLGAQDALPPLTPPPGGHWLGPSSLGAGAAAAPAPVLPQGCSRPGASVLGRVEALALRPGPAALLCWGDGQALGQSPPWSPPHTVQGASQSPPSLSALPPLRPMGPGMGGGPPEWTQPPPIICWKVQRRRGGWSPRRAPGLSGPGSPPTCPPPSEPHPQRHPAPRPPHPAAPTPGRSLPGPPRRPSSSKRRSPRGSRPPARPRRSGAGSGGRGEHLLRAQPEGIASRPQWANTCGAGTPRGPLGEPRAALPQIRPVGRGAGGGRVDCELLAGLGLPPSRPWSPESSPAAPPAARAPEGQPGRRPRPPASAGPNGPAGWEEAWELEASGASAAHSLHLLRASAPDRHTQGIRDTDAVNRRSCLSSRISPVAFSPGKTKPPGATEEGPSGGSVWWKTETEVCRRMAVGDLKFKAAGSPTAAAFPDVVPFGAAVPQLGAGNRSSPHPRDGEDQEQQAAFAEGRGVLPPWLSRQNLIFFGGGKGGKELSLPLALAEETQGGP
ncbi:collagen alpha-1(I) chain-like [Phacochoerus africanus]|uniref:collagen alpha-1(I) chain-like n=1 Tax=Phacochoerus africanus TaxID=41426 RepID=UPI001FD9C527|nr:collagen alpha-1(I) chain-like [Phacochoerus africanus]